jgi:hypothetical protein
MDDSDVTMPSSEIPVPADPDELVFCKCNGSKNCPAIRLVSHDGSIEIFDAERGLPRGDGMLLDREDALALRRWLSRHVG